MITGGRNLGRVGTVTHRERHPGSFDIVHIKDSQGHTFATRCEVIDLAFNRSSFHIMGRRLMVHTGCKNWALCSYP